MWAQIEQFGKQIRIAVYRLEKREELRLKIDSQNSRYGLIISAPGLESVLGPLITKCAKPVTTGSVMFVMQNTRTTITLTDVNDTEWPKFEVKATMAAKLRWDGVYVPSGIDIIGLYPPTT